MTRADAVLDDPARPLVVVLGGAKVTDKVGVIDRFLEIADQILIGGAMCFSFFRAQGIETGDSLVEEEGVELAREGAGAGAGSDCELVLPVDLVLGESFDADTERRERDGVEVPDGWMGLDIGPRQRPTPTAEAIAGAGTVLWNGPMGAFELAPFAAGTRTVAEAVAAAPGDHRGRRRRFGRGDLASSASTDEVDWVSTGGGASLGAARRERHCRRTPGRRDARCRPQTPLLAANWKMNKTVAEAERFVDALLPRSDRRPRRRGGRLPAVPGAAAAGRPPLRRHAASRSPPRTCTWRTRGAFTGEISAADAARARRRRR